MSETNHITSHINTSQLIQKMYYVTKSTPGNYIINARTGKPYPYKVGTYESLRLFRVYDTTGFVDINGYLLHKTSDNFPNRDSNILYYDSPQEMKFHLMNNEMNNILEGISFDDEKLWNNRVKFLFPDGSFSLEAYKKWNTMSYNEQLSV